MNRSPLRRLLLAIAALALVGAACGDDDTTASAGGDGPVEIESAWARSTAPTATAGAAYMEITSDSDREIIGASVPEDVAGRVELHETVAADDRGMGDADGETDMDHGDHGAMRGDEGGMDGMGGMTMKEVTQIDLPAGETVVLEPGGLHVMLLELPDPLESGETFALTLQFDDGSTQEVDVEVRDDAP